MEDIFLRRRIAVPWLARMTVIWPFAVSALVILMSVSQPNTACASYLDTRKVTVGVATDILVAMQGNTPGNYTAGLNLFNRHFTRTLSNSTGYTFDVVSLTYSQIFVAVENRTVDFAFINSGVLACLVSEFDAIPISSIYFKMYGMPIPTQSGVIFAQANRQDITQLSDIRGKTVAALSLSSLVGAQLEWLEMLKAGVDLMNAPAQVQIRQTSLQIVRDVLSGNVDIGFAQSGTLETYTFNPATAPFGATMANFSIINSMGGPRAASVSSTASAPMNGLIALPHVDINLQAKMEQSMYQLVIPSGTPGFEMDFSPAANYNRVLVTLKQVGWMTGGTSADNYRGTCPRIETLYNAIGCQQGYYKLSQELIDAECASQGLSCPAGASCVCKPCQKIPEVAIQVSAIAGSWLSDELADATHLHETAQICSKMVVCGTFDLGKNVTLIVRNNLFGIPTPQTAAHLPYILEYATALNANLALNSSWQEGVIGGASNSSIILHSLTLGINIVAIRVNYEQIPESPFVIEVVLPECTLPNMIVDQQNGRCVCQESFVMDDKNMCIRKPGLNMLAIIITPLAATLILCALIVAIVKHQNQKAAEATWRIKLKDITHYNPPIILGQGAFGVVVKARYRGTDVAIKTIISDRATGSGRSTGSVGLKFPIDKNLLSGSSAKDRRYAPALASNIVSECSYSAGATSRLPNDLIPPTGGSASNLLADAKPKAPPKPTRFISLQIDAISDFADKQLTSLKPKSKVVIPEKSGQSFSQKVAAATKSMLARSETKFIHEIKTMVHLRHPCITTIMGAVIEKGQQPQLVMELMERGSLYDLIHNETVDLDAPMIASILKDVVSGMKYLHLAKPPVLHLDVKSLNLLIDANFRTKVADFGLVGKKGKGIGSAQWMAPEMLRCEIPTTAADVYSFGVVMFEIYSRKEPYAGEALEDIIRTVGLGGGLGSPSSGEPQTNKRPGPIPESMPTALRELMLECWQEDPLKRPSFVEIEQRISRLDEGNMIDNMMMKRKSMDSRHDKDNSLLHDVFPARIAKQLRDGLTVEPESYDVVTIFFSDICGFTDISRELAPAEVMNMLNRLYQAFDAITRKHGLFKVETIGDAYMVVGGLPEPQSDHTKRIAEFALEVVAAANKVQVKPDDPSMGTINIRVGFHSGPCVASVVGSLNPRYCLFGDTVNTASRMESNSEKNRIHCSAAAAELLREQAPHLKLVSRGIIPIKGKGDMQTFWVTGPASPQM